MDDSLLREVDEALRADRAAALWQKHKQSILAFVAALLVGTALYSLWQHHRETKGGELLVAFTAQQALLTAGNAAEAAAGFERIAGDASGEVKGLAHVWQARALLAAKKTPEAVAVLTAAASDGHHLWSDMACLRLAGLDAKAAMPCLQDTSHSPLASTRAEWLAANLWAEGKASEAVRVLEHELATGTHDAETKARLTQWVARMEPHNSDAAK